MSVNKFIKHAIVLILSIVSLFSLTACGKDSGYFRIESSDKGFDAFYNEYYLRHTRERDYAVNHLELGYGSLYMKEWETRSLNWMDTTALSGDRLGKIKYYITDFPIDKFGYMWSTSYGLDGTTNTDVHNAFGQGWPIPNYLQSGGRNYGHEFETVTGWTSNGEVSILNGLMVSKVTANELWYLSPDLNVKTEYAPFIALDIRVTDFENYSAVNNIEDIYIEWQTVEDGDRWFEVSQKEWSTIPETEIGSFFGRKMYFPMYLNPDWDGKTVKKVKISVRASGDKELYLKGELNYVRLDFDTRQSNNNTLFLCYANEYFKFNNDLALMQENLTKFRKMTTFTLEHLKGKDGLLDISYLYGHDGLGSTVGHGIGNGYWDIFSAPSINLDANLYFYKSLIAMAEMEERATSYGLNVDKSQAVIADQTGQGTVTYNQTAESLRTLAQTVKNRISEYFWNEQTGRFHYGIVEGRKIDYGYVQFNLEALTAGVATEEQARSVMGWINGERIVAGDTSTGEDIYFFKFAPRSTTKKNYTDYVFNWPSGRTLPFGEQVQDGGAIMYVTYYDLISREQVYGANDCFARMKEIQAWYEDVQTAGGKGDNFYRAYYSTTPYLLQGGGQVGGLGLDEEFLENAMVYNYVSDVLLNLDASVAYNLKISPKLPDGLEYLNCYNLYYDGITYDLKITQNSVEIKNVRGNTDGKTVTITSPSGKTETTAFKKIKV